jgi:hypothetical protein
MGPKRSSAKKPADDEKSTTIVADDPDDLKGSLAPEIASTESLKASGPLIEEPAATFSTYHDGSMTD